MKTIKKKPIGVPFRGNRLRRLPRMIYWWAWGAVEFDIRNVREALGHPRERKDDCAPFDCGSHDRIANHLDKITGDSDFRKVLKAAKVIEARESAKFLTGGSDEDIPF